MFTFQWPFLAILLPLPFLIRAYFPAKKTENEASPELYFPHLSGLQTAFQGAGAIGKNKKRNLVSWLFFLAWALLVAALMRPQIIDRLNQVRNEGHDLMLAVDLSGSMQSLDFAEGDQRVSRLDVAKNVVKDFVRKRSGDRIGLILFGEHAYLQSPLTLDTDAVSKMLDNSLSGMAGDATAIGDAIGLAVKNLRDRPAQSRALILLTDGEDNASTIAPLQAAQLAKQYGIHIYTIVIGKEGVVPFPDGNGGTELVESHVDTTLTKKIAEMTGGEFYRSQDQSSLASIYNRIDALEKSESEAQTTLIRKPLYPYPMALALTLLGILGIAAQMRRESYDFSTI
jgi:Ca-activated chloride channel family protein